MNRGLIIDFSSVAAYLAHENSSTQAEFLNTFAKELQAVCGTNHHTELQMHHAAKHLTGDTKNVLKTLTFEPA